MKAFKWIGNGYTRPQTWPFKKDMPAEIKHEAERVSFGIFGVGYIALNAEGVLMKDGKRLPVFKFYLKTPGATIGPRDAQAAANMPWAFEWQTACADKHLELAELHAKVGGNH